MAKSVGRQCADNLNIVPDTWTFMWKKLKSILPYHIAFNLFMVFVSIARRKTLVEIINRLSSFLFLPTLGFNNHEWMLAAEWYIGYMLFTMLIIYPFLRRFNKLTAGYVAPVASVITYGYLAKQYGTVMGSNRTMEAFAGILLGISVYSMSEAIKEKLSDRQINKAFSILIKLYPVTAIVCILLYMNTSLSTSVQPVLVVFLGTGLAITFAEKGLLSSTGLMNNSFVYWLGEMSLPIYMVQNITRMIVMNCLSIGSIQMVYIVEAITTLMAGIMSYYILNMFVKRIVCNKSI